MFALIDKELDESDGEIIPYQQLASKEQVGFKFEFYKVQIQQYS